MTKMTSTWRRLLAEEWRWFRSHGGSLEAYVQRYGSATDPNCFGNGGEAIYQADVDALKRKIRKLAGMTSMNPRNGPKVFLND